MRGHDVVPHAFVTIHQHKSSAHIRIPCTNKVRLQKTLCVVISTRHIHSTEMFLDLSKLSRGSWIKHQVSTKGTAKYHMMFLYGKYIYENEIVDSLKLSRWVPGPGNCTVAVTDSQIVRSRVSAGLILGSRPANQRRRYRVTPSLIGWAQTENQPCKYVQISLKHPDITHWPLIDVKVI